METNFFADLESDLPALDQCVDAPVGYLNDALRFAQSGNENQWQRTKRLRERPIVDCTKCRATGKFYSYTGRYVGPCLKCDGTGKIAGLHMDDKSVRAREQAAARREAKKAAAEAAKVQWAQDHADVIQWIDRNPTFVFAASLGQSVSRFGSLTDKQVEAARRCIEREAARQAERAAQAAAPMPADALDLSSLPQGRYAVPDGDTRLKVLVRKPTDGQWAGFVFVSDAAEYGQRTRYGMQAPNKGYRGQIEDALRKIVAAPEAALVAYGKLTGCCGVCGRALEDEASVARGIGPICAEKLGFAA